MPLDNTEFILSEKQAVVRLGLLALIGKLDPVPGTVSVSNVAEMESRIAQNPAAVVVFDLDEFVDLDEGRLLDLVRKYPSVRWVAFQEHFSDEVLERLSKKDTVSLVLKSDDEPSLLSAFRMAAENKRYISQQLIGSLLREDSASESMRLTKTETEILKLIAMGYTVKEIAAMRCKSEHTIVSHKKNIFAKLGVNNIHDATKFALRSGLVDLVEYYI